MSIKTWIVLCLLSFVVCTEVSASERGQLTWHDKKMIDPAAAKQCKGLDHGLMMRCILNKMRTLEEEVNPVPIPKAIDADLKTPESMQQKKNPIAADKDSIAKGKSFYSFYCSSCHGASGQGNGPLAPHFAQKVADLTDPQLRTVSDGALMWRITEGGWPMPAFGYQKEWNETDLWNVINYIRTLSGTKQ